VPSRRRSPPHHRDRVAGSRSDTSSHRSCRPRTRARFPEYEQMPGVHARRMDSWMTRVAGIGAVCAVIVRPRCARRCRDGPVPAVNAGGTDLARLLGRIGDAIPVREKDQILVVFMVFSVVGSVRRVRCPKRTMTRAAVDPPFRRSPNCCPPTDRAECPHAYLGQSGLRAAGARRTCCP